MTDDGLLTVRLRSITFEAEGINSYALEPLPGGRLPLFTAGSHVDVHVADGVVRSYSLLNDARDRDRYVIGVQNDPNSRGGSRAMHEALRPGATLTISPPRNSFPLHEDATLSVLIAGGIGVTPLLSMAERLAAAGLPWVLHYATRTVARTAFRDRLTVLAAGQPARVRLYHDGEPDGQAMDVGALVAAAPAEAHLYCCGPVPLLAAFEAAVAGRLPGHAHVEYFSAREEAATEGGYILKLARSGRQVHVLPGQTMLAALLEAGANVAFACAEGVCGTCETAVVAGIPDHRDGFLTEAERTANATVMICCSGSCTPVLELDL